MEWFAAGEHELPQTQEWMTQSERSRLDALRFTKRRTEYLLRRWTAKRAVATARNLAGDLLGPVDRQVLARLEVGNHPTGAPFVLLDGAPLGSDISVTDRAGWAVCLVGTPGERMSAVGVDLEIVEPRSDGFVADFLTLAEQDDVRSRPGRPEQDAAANLYWSAKEAALKVLRTGLRADTRTVEVTPATSDRDDGWARLQVRHTPSGRVFLGWWRQDGTFLLTMVTDATDDAARPPVALPGSGQLAAAVPVHSWMAQPTAW